MNRHLVGQVTDFGLLLGDSVRADFMHIPLTRYNRLESVVTVAWYRNLDNDTYLIIEWDVRRDGTSTELSRDTFDKSSEAWSTYLVRAFGIMM
jgi:hypothetical protein